MSPWADKTPNSDEWLDILKKHARWCRGEGGRKCRADAAVVMSVFPAGAKAESLHVEGFFYELGATVRPDNWDEDWTNECGGGLHFYITEAEARAHS